MSTLLRVGSHHMFIGIIHCFQQFAMIKRSMYRLQECQIYIHDPWHKQTNRHARQIQVTRTLAPFKSIAVGLSCEWRYKGNACNYNCVYMYITKYQRIMR